MKTLFKKFVLLFCLFFPTVVACATEDHSPTALERAYVGLALDTERHDICAKISPKALENNLFNSPGTQTYYTRSACYQYLAQRTLNLFFCREVKEAKAGWLHSGDHFSQKNCVKFVNSGKPSKSHLGFDHGIVLRAAKYTDEDVKAVILDHPRPGSWMEFYHSFKRRGDGSILQRLNDLPDFSQK